MSGAVHPEAGICHRPRPELGEFFKAASAEELRRVYDTLGEQIGYEKKQADASKPWLLLGTMTAMFAAAAALLLGQRLP